MFQRLHLFTRQRANEPSDRLSEFSSHSNLSNSLSNENLKNCCSVFGRKMESLRKRRRRAKKIEKRNFLSIRQKKIINKHLSGCQSSGKNGYSMQGLAVTSLMKTVHRWGKCFQLAALVSDVACCVFISEDFFSLGRNRPLPEQVLQSISVLASDWNKTILCKDFKIVAERGCNSWQESLRLNHHFNCPHLRN